MNEVKVATLSPAAAEMEAAMKAYHLALTDVEVANRAVDYIRKSIGELSVDQARRVQTVVIELRHSGHVRDGILR